MLNHTATGTDVQTATLTELRRCLITCDGAGPGVKEQVLAEILHRACTACGNDKAAKRKRYDSYLTLFVDGIVTLALLLGICILLRMLF